MSNSGTTRFVRLSSDALEVRRNGGANDGTAFYGDEVRARGRGVSRLVSPAEVFNAWQARLARTVREASGKGVYVFALSSEGELAGQVWLKADDTLRATSVGRHTHCELFLPGVDPGLSLRHLLVLVRGTPRKPRCRVIDLRSEAGFTTSQGESQSSVLFSGAAVLAVPGYWLVFVPTGGVVPWKVQAEDAWSTLPRQELVPGEDWRAGDARVPERRRGVTQVHCFSPTPMFGSTPLLARGEEPVGQLVLDVDPERLTVRLGARALDRGVLLGRDERCLGLSSGIPTDVSRVHAVVLRDQGQVFIADAGSKNGVYLQREEVSAAPMGEGQRFQLGRTVAAWWETAH